MAATSLAVGTGGLVTPSASKMTTIGSYLDIRNDGVIDSEDSTVIVDIQNAVAALTAADQNATGLASDIEIHMLSYDKDKNLVDSPILLQNNLRNYLDEFRILTDEFTIYNGKVINFGVGFEVVSHKHANKYDVKLRCINKIIEYFNIDKMQFRQPIYTNDLIYELMGIDGVRAVNYLELTQGDLSSDNGSATLFSPQLYDASIDSAGSITTGNNTGYGYLYNFNNFYDSTIASDGVILPSVTPSVFELKNPNENIKGVVL